MRNKEVMKSRLEEAIMGQNSARSEMMLRRRGNTLPSSPHVVGHSQFYIQGAGWCRRSGPPSSLPSPDLTTLQVFLSAACATCLGFVRAPWLAHSANTYTQTHTSWHSLCFTPSSGGMLASLHHILLLHGLQWGLSAIFFLAMII